MRFLENKIELSIGLKVMLVIWDGEILFGNIFFVLLFNNKNSNILSYICIIIIWMFINSFWNRGGGGEGLRMLIFKFFVLRINILVKYTSVLKLFFKNWF